MSLLLAVPAKAADDAKKLALYQDVIQTIQAQMYMTYICKDVVGASYFDASEVIAEGTLQSLGNSHDDAVLLVDQYQGFILKALKSKGSVIPADAPQSKKESFCFEQINKAQHDAELAAAKARKAYGLP